MQPGTMICKSLFDCIEEAFVISVVGISRMAQADTCAGVLGDYRDYQAPETIFNKMKLSAEAPGFRQAEGGFL